MAEAHVSEAMEKLERKADVFFFYFLRFFSFFSFPFCLLFLFGGHKLGSREICETRKRAEERFAHKLLCIAKSCDDEETLEELRGSG
jgi:hypothetical protein